MQTLKYVSKASKITFISCIQYTDGITRHIVGTLAGQYLDEIVSVFILQNTNITFGLWMILFFSVKFQLLSSTLKNIYVHEQHYFFFISQLKKQLHIHVYVNNFFFTLSSVSLYHIIHQHVVEITSHHVFFKFQQSNRGFISSRQIINVCFFSHVRIRSLRFPVFRVREHFTFV